MNREQEALRMLRILRRDSKRMVQHLEARIDAAPSTAKPVFNGIVELIQAIHRTDEFLRKIKDGGQADGGEA